ncbi:MAG TPA: hypothetical protein VI756_07715, partial [Blastocatellia bacterium]
MRDLRLGDRVLRNGKQEAFYDNDEFCSLDPPDSYLMNQTGMSSRTLTLIADVYLALSSPLRVLLPVWLLFLVLVAAGIHGSSISCTAAWWDPSEPYTGYVFNDLTSSAATSADKYDLTLRDLAMAQPRELRSDEWLDSTPYALSQFAHRPRFPVINNNIGEGQNMLVGYLNPVWHITALARPAT